MGKAFQAKIKSSAYITLGPTALHTMQQTFDPGFPISFHLLTLTTEIDLKTICSSKRQTLYAHIRLLFYKHSACTPLGIADKFDTYEKALKTHSLTNFPLKHQIINYRK